MTLNSDVGVIKVAASYMSLRAMNCFETAAAWDAKLKERYNLFFFAQCEPHFMSIITKHFQENDFPLKS